MKETLQTAFSKRQYMLSKDFEIYYYSNRDFTQVENHKHNYYEFYFFLEGDISIVIEGVPHRLIPGDVVQIPPGVSHYAVSHCTDKAYRRFVFWISQEYCQRLMDQSVCYGYILQHVAVSKEYILHTDVVTFNTIQAKIIQLIEEIHGNQFAKDEKIVLCVNDLMLHLNRTMYQKNHGTSQAEGNSLYQNIVYYIESHLEDELTLDEIGNAFFVSKYHIAHIFKENMGISVRQYISKKRLKVCKEAIESGMSIKEAFLVSGFKEYSSFFRAFRKEFGISPAKLQQSFKAPF